MKKNNLIFFIMILLSILSCSKSKQKKLIGTWELIPMNSVDTGSVTTWTFYDNNSLIISKTSDTISYDTATYQFTEKFFKYYIDIYGYDIYSDGYYFIEKINNNILILQMEHPNYYRREFTKK